MKKIIKFLFLLFFINSAQAQNGCLDACLQEFQQLQLQIAAARYANTASCTSSSNVSWGDILECQFFGDCSDIEAEDDFDQFCRDLYDANAESQTDYAWSHYGDCVSHC